MPVAYCVSVVPVLDDDRAPEQLIVAFELAEQSPASTPAATTEDLSSMHRSLVSELERELALTQANLQDTIQELGTANEELQATNEELMASNEELQSTNEELQSVNEELHTINAEFQAKITEINDMNADLESLTQATQIPLVFLDGHLRLTRFTAAATSLFRIREGDTGRSITDFTHQLDFPDLHDRLRDAAESIASHQREVTDASGRTWLITILPYSSPDQRQTRVVVTCIDLSNVRDARRLQSVLDSLQAQVAVLDQDGRITQVNRSWREFAERNGGDGAHSEGSTVNYLDACRPNLVPDHDADAVLAGLQELLAGRSTAFSRLYPCHSPDERRWFMMHAAPLDGGGCVVSHIDVTTLVDDSGRPTVVGDETSEHDR